MTEKIKNFVDFAAHMEFRYPRRNQTPLKFRRGCRVPSKRDRPVVQGELFTGGIRPEEPVNSCEQTLRENQPGISNTLYHYDEKKYDSIRDWNSGPRYQTRSGIRVRSKIEKIIADFFTDEGISFVYEPVIAIDGIRLRPDFYLPGYDLIYEHFGMDDDAYQRVAEFKKTIYQKSGASFIFTTAADEPDIEDVIVDQLALATLGL